MKKLQAFIMLIALCSPLFAQDPARQAKIDKTLPNLNSVDAKVRCKAIKLLFELNAKEHANKIAELLKDKDNYVKSYAIGALGKFRAKEYTKDIARFLNDNDISIQLSAVFTLGELGAKEYTNDIKELLKSDFMFSQIIAMVALANVGAKECAKDIAELLQHRIGLVRGNAVWALGKLNAKEYATKLKKLINDTEGCDIYDEPETKPKCPNCGNENVMSIIYGYVVLDDDAKELLKEGKMKLGGYCVSGNEPAWECKKCHYSWQWFTTVSAEAERVLKEWGVDTEKIKEQKEKSRDAK